MLTRAEGAGVVWRSLFGWVPKFLAYPGLLYQSASDRGAKSGIVRIDLDPRQMGYFLGWPSGH